MIDINKAKQEFKKYVSNYDITSEHILLKITHTYGVMQIVEYMAGDLKLSEEDLNIARIIALLHDIGRFEQFRIYGSFFDYKTIDHADFSVKLLFEDGLIKNFIEDRSYDNIIKTAIKYHNKYKIKEEGLTEKELLHSKIIRDADKTDNFRVKMDEKLSVLLYTENYENDKITDEVYESFLRHELVKNEIRVTSIDLWISYMAFIYDYSFLSSIKYIKDKNYINLMVDRIKYKDRDTFNKMQNVRECSNQYIEDKILKGGI